MEYLITTTNGELHHHGIKGQKWGVRRYQNPDGTLTAKGKKRRESDNNHEDYREAHSKKKISEMSNQELRNRVNRLNMEQQYNKMMSSTDVSKGKKIVKKVLAAVGTLAATTTTFLTLYNNTDKLKNSMKPQIDKIKEDARNRSNLREDKKLAKTFI